MQIRGWKQFLYQGITYESYYALIISKIYHRLNLDTPSNLSRLVTSRGP